MPTYEYQCQACTLRFERFQSISSPAISQCPECKKNQVQRLISGGIGIIYKGSGFYSTDYRKPQPNKNATSQNTAAKKEK